MAKPSKRKKSTQKGNSGNHAAAQDRERSNEGASATGDHRLPWFLGIIALLVSVAASGILVLDHFGGMAAPGCGPGSPCAQAAESVWGSVPLIDWPVSFLGLTYFLAVLIAWSIARGAIGSMIWLVRIGALVSFAYVIIMLVNIQEYLCHWCMVSHVGNFVFLGMAEWTRRSIVAPTHDVTLRPLGHAFAGMAAITVVLASWQMAHSRALDREADRAIEESTEEIIRAGDEHIGFTGRYRMGPAEAPIRVVAFTGYQCPECQRFERQMNRIILDRDDVSFSVMHYPLNPDCNPHVQTRIHNNACHAARAAEAAGILHGEDGFWRMHHWLVQRRGAFTQPELTQALEQFGFNQRDFINAMTSAEALERINDDARRAHDLGIQSTPMVFINGVELRGPHASRRIRDAVESLAAQQPEALAAAADQPLNARQRTIEVWRDAAPRTIRSACRLSDLGRELCADDGWPLSIGPDDAPVTIHLWGDYTHERTAQADALIRDLIHRRTDVRYEYRLFPLHSDCNPIVEVQTSPRGCLAAMLALAVAQQGGADAYRTVHDWLMRMGPALREADIHSAAAATMLDTDALRNAVRDPRIAELISRDAEEYDRIAERPVAPLVIINGRAVPLWQHDEYDLLDAIVEEALREAQ